MLALPVRRLVVVLPLLGLLVASCAGYKNARDKLHATSFTFNDNVRWQRFRAAARSIPEPRREAWVVAMERAARSFTIADWDMVPVEIGDDTAVLHVDLVYLQSPGVTVQHMRRRQVWRHDLGDWTLESDIEVPYEESGAPPGLPDLVGPEPEAGS